MNNKKTASFWDTVIVGGGAAGLSAALLLGRARRRVLVIDSGSPRNRFAAHMHGVLGNEGTRPEVFVENGREEAASYGVQFRNGLVDSVDETERGLRIILTDRTVHEARSLIVATGITDRLPDIPGLAERWGTSILHCPYCHGWEVRDQRLGVLATSPASLHQAQLVRQWSEHITLFSAALGDLDAATVARLRSRDVEIVTSPVVEVLGNGDQVTGVRTQDGQEFPLEAVFTAGTPVPHDNFLKSLNLTRAEMPFGLGSFIEVDPTGKTSHPRVWAIGNVVNPMASVPMAVGAGAFTGGAVNGALVDEDFALATSQA
ncbi:NAD(P)/FAD-dependent oxidoreductase [Populibacterium corticicola]|uniref:NAD(P)/FAD-dependent oxidoreductase n=1 Tax=Populibacterium corticicola TaxID=1812826 RepID=A0ABW5XGC6_9MICO